MTLESLAMAKKESAMLSEALAEERVRSASIDKTEAIEAGATSPPRTAPWRLTASVTPAHSPTAAQPTDTSLQRALAAQWASASQSATTHQATDAHAASPTRARSATANWRKAALGSARAT